MPHNVEILYTQRPSVFSRRLWDHHFNALPPSCRDYILKFHRPEDRQDRLLARLLVRKLLLGFGYPANCLEQISLDKNQRPFIDERTDFNISHSDNLITCAASTKCRVGIDIEKISSVKFSDTLPTLPTAEQKLVQSAANPQQEFFALWTIRESVLKAAGFGLVGTIDKSAETSCQYLVKQQPYFSHKLNLVTGYSCHLATNTRNIEFHLAKISIFNL